MSFVQRYSIKLRAPSVLIWPFVIYFWAYAINPHAPREPQSNIFPTSNHFNFRQENTNRNSPRLNLYFIISSLPFNRPLKYIHSNAKPEGQLGFFQILLKTKFAQWDTGSWSIQGQNLNNTFYVTCSLNI